MPWTRVKQGSPPLALLRAVTPGTRSVLDNFARAQSASEFLLTDTFHNLGCVDLGMGANLPMLATIRSKQSPVRRGPLLTRGPNAGVSPRAQAGDGCGSQRDSARSSVPSPTGLRMAIAPRPRRGHRFQAGPRTTSVSAPPTLSSRAGEPDGGMRHVDVNVHVRHGRICMLRCVSQSFRHHVVGGDLDPLEVGSRSSFRARREHWSGVRASAAQRQARPPRGSPGGCRVRVTEQIVDRARKPGDHPIDLVDQLGLVRRHRCLDCPKLHCDRNELLLRAVVKVALDFAPRFVGASDKRERDAISSARA